MANHTSRPDQPDGDELEPRGNNMQRMQTRRAGDQRRRHDARRRAQQEQPAIGGGVARRDVLGRQQRLSVAFRRGAIDRRAVDRRADPWPLGARRFEVAAVEHATGAAVGASADAASEVLLEAGAFVGGRRRADEMGDHRAERRLERLRRNLVGPSSGRRVARLFGPQQSRRAVLRIDDDDRCAAPRRLLDDLPGAAAPVGRLAVPHRDQDVALRQHGQSRGLERRRQSRVGRRPFVAGQRQRQRRAGAPEQRLEFFARSVLDESLRVDRLRAGQYDVERPAGGQRGVGGNAVGALGERRNQRNDRRRVAKARFGRRVDRRQSSRCGGERGCERRRDRRDVEPARRIGAGFVR